MLLWNPETIKQLWDVHHHYDGYSSKAKENPEQVICYVLARRLGLRTYRSN